MAELNCTADLLNTSASKCMFNCGCVGYAYVPVQELEKVFGVDSAIKCGTVFPELELGIDEYGKVCKQWGDTSDE